MPVLGKKPQTFDTKTVVQATDLFPYNRDNGGGGFTDANILLSDFLASGNTFRVFGDWNALTNSPTLVSSTGIVGEFYRVSVAGDTVLDTLDNWQIDDWIYFDGTVWRVQRSVPNTAGAIDGFVVSFNSTTSIDISPGFCEVDGKLFSLPAAIGHGMTGLVAGADFHYIYVDVSATVSFPTPIIINNTTEPTFDSVRRGFYNGDDRCIGVVESPAASSTIRYFTNKVSGKYVEATIGRQTNMATNMNPSGAWQTPNVLDGSAVTPVNAVSISMTIFNTDVGTNLSLYISTQEMAVANTNISQGTYETFKFTTSSDRTPFIPLDASRNVRITGDNDDDNFLSAWVAGYGYNR